MIYFRQGWIMVFALLQAAALCWLSVCEAGNPDFMTGHVVNLDADIGQVPLTLEEAYVRLDGAFSEEVSSVFRVAFLEASRHQQELVDKSRFVHGELPVSGVMESFLTHVMAGFEDLSPTPTDTYLRLGNFIVSEWKLDCSSPLVEEFRVHDVTDAQDILSSIWFGYGAKLAGKEKRVKELAGLWKGWKR